MPLRIVLRDNAPVATVRAPSVDVEPVPVIEADLRVCVHLEQRRRSLIETDAFSKLRVVRDVTANVNARRQRSPVDALVVVGLAEDVVASGIVLRRIAFRTPAPSRLGMHREDLVSNRTLDPLPGNGIPQNVAHLDLLRHRFSRRNAGWGQTLSPLRQSVRRCFSL